MTQLTLRGFDLELERALKRLARQQGVSLNQAALRLMRKGAGLESAVLEPIGDAIEPFVGVLSSKDANAVRETINESDKQDLAFQRSGQRR